MRITTRLLLGTIAVLGAMLSLSHRRLSSALARTSALALRADSVAATSDTTRQIQIETLDESLQVVQRRSVQRAQMDDAIDRALMRYGVAERTSRAEIEVKLGALRATISGATVGAKAETGTRRATFTIAQPPFSGTANVTIPKAPEPAGIELALELERARLDVRLGCGDPVDGIRPATVSVAAPRWLEVSFSRVEQDPGVCRSPALEGHAARWSLRLDPVYAGIVETKGGD